MASIKFFDSHTHMFGGFEDVPAKIVDSKQIDGINLILAHPSEKNYEKLNAKAFALAKKYGKKVQLALWIDPLKEGGPAEAVKYLDAHRDIRGLKFHPTGDKWQITEKIAGPYLDIAMERDLFVITHTQPTEGQHAICYYDLLKKRPELRFIVGHSSTIEESIFLSVCCNIQCGSATPALNTCKGVLKQSFFRGVVFMILSTLLIA